MNDKIMKLSEEDTIRLQEQHMDESAANAVLDRAMSYHHYQMAGLMKSKRVFWDHVKEAYNLDPTKRYEAKWSDLERRYIILESEIDAE